MAPRRSAPVAGFLDELIARHRARLPRERAYEAMMYAARDPPSGSSIASLVEFLRTARTDARAHPEDVDEAALHGLRSLFARMVWPDPAPLSELAAILPGWNTVALTTVLHSQIPDYPIFGPAEAAGLRRLGHRAEYHDDPTQAVDAYGLMIRAVKDIREDARYDQVPESHHFLTRIVQTALEETGADA